MRIHVMPMIASLYLHAHLVHRIKEIIEIVMYNCLFIY